MESLDCIASVCEQQPFKDEAAHLCRALFCEKAFLTPPCSGALGLVSCREPVDTVCQRRFAVGQGAGEPFPESSGTRLQGQVMSQ